MKQIRRTIVCIGITGMLSLAGLVFLVPSTRADDGGTFWGTILPSSQTFDSYYYNYRGTEPPTTLSSGSSPSSCVWNDSTFQNIYQLSGEDWWTVQTGGFNAGTWNGLNQTRYGYESEGPQLIWDNATNIRSVDLVVVFKYPEQISSWTFDLELSTNNGSSWTYSYPGDAHIAFYWGYPVTGPNLEVYYLDVKNWRTWTPTMLKSNDTKVRMTIYPDPGVDASIDYLGLTYLWDAPNHWVPPVSNGTIPTVPSSGGMTLGINNGTFSLIGFLVMIATLPVAVWKVKTTDTSKLWIAFVAFVSICVSGAVFIGFA